MSKQIAVFGSFLTRPGSADYALAEELGFLLARQGLEVLCGGHGGIADPLAAGVARGGGRVQGIFLVASRAPQRQSKINPLITAGSPMTSLGARMERFAAADGFIFFSGGLGTLCEFAFVWHSLQLDADFDRPLVLLGRRWARLLARIRSEQMVKSKYYRMLRLEEGAVDALAAVTNDYTLKSDLPGSLQNKRLVLFELEGTLVEAPEETLVRVCENFGRFYPLQEVRQAFRETAEGPKKDRSGQEVHTDVLLRLGVEPQAAAEIVATLGHGGDDLPPIYADAAEALACSRRLGLATGVVSSRPLPQVKALLAAHGLAGQVDLLCPQSSPPDGGADVGLAVALRRAGWHLAETVYIGARPDLGRFGGDLEVILLDRYLSYLDQGSVTSIRSLRELTALLGCSSAAGSQRPSPVL